MQPQSCLHWSQYHPITKAVLYESTDLDIAVFTLSKLTGDMLALASAWVLL